MLARATQTRRGGFTLIEILVVISVLATLFGLVVATTGGFMGRAAEKATMSMILRTQTWMDEYRSLTGYYPRDGLDSRVRSKEGVDLRGTAALYVALTEGVVAEEFVGSRTRWRKHPPVAKIEGGELSLEDPDYPGVREIVDGFGTPMHYDNTANGRYVPQDGSVHYPPVEGLEHPDDPREGDREVDGHKAVRKRGIQDVGYDLWSHGYHGHEAGTPASLPVATWNVQNQVK